MGLPDARKVSYHSDVKKRGKGRRKNPAASIPRSVVDQVASDSSVMFDLVSGVLAQILPFQMGPYPKTYGPVAVPVPESHRVDPPNVVTLQRSDDGEFRR